MRQFNAHQPPWLQKKIKRGILGGKWGMVLLCLSVCLFAICFIDWLAGKNFSFPRGESRLIHFANWSNCCCDSSCWCWWWWWCLLIITAIIGLPQIDLCVHTNHPSITPSLSIYRWLIKQITNKGEKTRRKIRENITQIENSIVGHLIELAEIWLYKIRLIVTMTDSVESSLIYWLIDRLIDRFEWSVDRLVEGAFLKWVRSDPFIFIPNELDEPCMVQVVDRQGTSSWVEKDHSGTAPHQSE